MRFSRWPVVAVSAAAAVAVAGCGGGSATSADGSEQQGGGKSPVAVVQAAYQATTGVKTAKLSMSQHIATQATTVKLNGSGAMNFGTSAVRLEMKTGSAASGGAMGAMAQGPITVRMVDGVVYTKVPKGSAKFMPKPWMKIDARKIAKKSGARVPGMARMGHMRSPAQALALLRGASDQVTELGKERVRGAPTTHYKLVVNMQELVTKQGGGKKLAQQLRKTVGSTMPVHVWIDKQNRVRRQKMNISAKQQGKKADVSVTVEFYDFGAPVQVTAPPPNKTMSLIKMMKKMEHMTQRMQDKLGNSQGASG